MNLKYPEAYGTCYKTGGGRIVGLRVYTGICLSQFWFVGYVDNRSSVFPLRRYEITNLHNAELAQKELDEIAKENGWEVAE